MNLLFTNIGRKTYLLEYALDLREEYDLNIFICDTSRETAGFHVSKKVHSFITPRVLDDQDEYINVLLKKCKDNNIEIIIPLMDFELPVLSRKKDLFKTKGIEIIISDFSVIDACLDKEKNYAFCIDNGLKVPKSYFQLPGDDTVFPLILKKRRGSGSVGQKLINTPEELRFYYNDEYVVQEYIEGVEIGMDVFNDLNGRYVHSAFRKKILMRAGETDKAKSIYFPELERLAKSISASFKHIGNMDVDIIKDDAGNLFCIDFNPRFGGGYPLTHLSGFNYLKYILELYLHKKITVPVRYKTGTVLLKGISTYIYNEN
ncbi:MAG: ATP-grasp domain-containing protein [Spirochaetales bacterium]|nr:ATP-grasp domain-containing protein [Spirochaetales bacterium]